MAEKEYLLGNRAMQNIYKKQHRAQEQSGAFSPVPRPADIPPWQ